MVVSRDQTQGQSAAIVNAALLANTATLPVFTGADLEADGFAVVKVTKVLPHTAATPADTARERGSYAQAWSAAESAAYFNMLKDRMKVQILVPKPTANTAAR